MQLFHFPEHDILVALCGLDVERIDVVEVMERLADSVRIIMVGELIDQRLPRILVVRLFCDHLLEQLQRIVMPAHAGEHLGEKYTGGCVGRMPGEAVDKAFTRSLQSTHFHLDLGDTGKHARLPACEPAQPLQFTF